MKNRPLTEAESQRLIALTPWIVIALALLLAFLATSCSVQESLLVHNPRDYKVLSYDYPYAEVLVFKPDSVIEYRYSLEPLAIGSYGISECRRVRK